MLRRGQCRLSRAVAPSELILCGGLAQRAAIKVLSLEWRKSMDRDFGPSAETGVSRLRLQRCGYARSVSCDLIILSVRAEAAALGSDLSTHLRARLAKSVASAITGVCVVAAGS